MKTDTDGRCRGCQHFTFGSGGHSGDCSQGKGYNIDANWGCDEFAPRAPPPTPLEALRAPAPSPSAAGAPDRAPIHWLGDDTQDGDVWELNHRYGRGQVMILGRPTTLYLRMRDGTNVLVPVGWWIGDRDGEPFASSARPPSPPPLAARPSSEPGERARLDPDLARLRLTVRGFLAHAYGREIPFDLHQHLRDLAALVPDCPWPSAPVPSEPQGPTEDALAEAIRWLEETHASDGDEGAIEILGKLRRLRASGGVRERVEALRAAGERVLSEIPTTPRRPRRRCVRFATSPASSGRLPLPLRRRTAMRDRLIETLRQAEEQLRLMRAASTSSTEKLDRAIARVVEDRAALSSSSPAPESAGPLCLCSADPSLAGQFSCRCCGAKKGEPCRHAAPAPRPEETRRMVATNACPTHGAVRHLGCDGCWRPEETRPATPGMPPADWACAAGTGMCPGREYDVRDGRCTWCGLVVMPSTTPLPEETPDGR